MSSSSRPISIKLHTSSPNGNVIPSPPSTVYLVSTLTRLSTGRLEAQEAAPVLIMISGNVSRSSSFRIRTETCRLIQSLKRLAKLELCETFLCLIIPNFLLLLFPPPPCVNFSTTCNQCRLPWDDRDEWEETQTFILLRGFTRICAGDSECRIRCQIVDKFRRF